MFSIPKRILNLEGIVAPSLRSIKYTLALAVEGFLAGTACCASIGPSMAIVARTINQVRENRYIGCPHDTLTWASRVNKLRREPIARSPSLGLRCPVAHQSIAAAPTGYALKSGVSSNNLLKLWI